MQPSVATRQASAPPPVVSQRVAQLRPDGSAVRCVLSDERSLTLSRFLASFIRPSDQLEFDPTAADPMRELRVVQNTPRRPRELYFVPIGYVTQPKPDKRDEYFVRAEVIDGRLGIRHLYLPNQAVRDYFYFGNRRRAGCEEQTLYDLLRTVPTAAPADLRLALKVRLLELQTDAAPKDQIQAVERAFNLLAHPDLRSCYQALLLDPGCARAIPLRRISARCSPPENSRRTVRPFSPGRSCRSSRTVGSGGSGRLSGKSSSSMTMRFIATAGESGSDPGSDLASSCVRPDVEPVAAPGQHKIWRGGDIRQEREIPASRRRVASGRLGDGSAQSRSKSHSRVTCKKSWRMPARRTTDSASSSTPSSGSASGWNMSRSSAQELDRICDELRIPPDFDIAQISWKPDYDWFYYGQLRKRTRKMFLFRDEYIFELERAIVVEVPQQGHATYVFSRPANLDQWVREYARTLKDDIRQNRANVAERLGFLGRVMHGRNPRRPGYGNSARGLVNQWTTHSRWRRQ